MKLVPRRVLDAGSGPLRDARRLARRYRDAQVLALDFSPAMLRAGRPRLRLFERNAPRAVGGELGRIPLAGGSVDLVWSNMALHWVADPQAVLREFHRVLAVGGLLMFSALGPDTLAELRAAPGAPRAADSLGKTLMPSGLVVAGTG